MTSNSLKLLLVSTPVGFLGSGKGGGVEVTIVSLIKGLLGLGHSITVLAPKGSVLPVGCDDVELVEVSGVEQPSWQHRDYLGSALIPLKGVLPRLWEQVLNFHGEVDAVINFGYDWLPIWLTPRIDLPIFHLISMGGVSQIMKELIQQIFELNNSRFAFHTNTQASDFSLKQSPIIIGNGFDINQYSLNLNCDGPLGWVGRVAPEKGLEDAALVASALNERLIVWGLVEDSLYAKRVEESVPRGTIEWKGYLSTQELQEQLGCCRAMLNTPKWNEAYGNVVVEALACGVPVVAYNRGGPGELILSGQTGFLVEPDDIDSMIAATKQVNVIDRMLCRDWVVENASLQVFAKRVEDWIRLGL